MKSLLIFIFQEEESRRDERLQYSCKCSFLEIYNEQITDLLDPSSTNLMVSCLSSVWTFDLKNKCNLLLFVHTHIFSLSYSCERISQKVFMLKICPNLKSKLWVTFLSSWLRWQYLSILSFFINILPFAIIHTHEASFLNGIKIFSWVWINFKYLFRAL